MQLRSCHQDKELNEGSCQHNVDLFKYFSREVFGPGSCFDLAVKSHDWHLDRYVIPTWKYPSSVPSILLSGNSPTWKYPWKYLAYFHNSPTWNYLKCLGNAPAVFYILLSGYWPDPTTHPFHFPSRKFLLQNLSSNFPLFLVHTCTHGQTQNYFVTTSPHQCTGDDDDDDSDRDVGICLSDGSITSDERLWSSDSFVSDANKREDWWFRGNPAYRPLMSN